MKAESLAESEERSHKQINTPVFHGLRSTNLSHLKIRVCGVHSQHDDSSQARPKGVRSGISECVWRSVIDHVISQTTEELRLTSTTLSQRLEFPNFRFFPMRTITTRLTVNAPILREGTNRRLSSEHFPFRKTNLPKKKGHFAQSRNELDSRDMKSWKVSDFSTPINFNDRHLENRTQI